MNINLDEFREKLTSVMEEQMLTELNLKTNKLSHACSCLTKAGLDIAKCVASEKSMVVEEE